MVLPRVAQQTDTDTQADRHNHRTQYDVPLAVRIVSHLYSPLLFGRLAVQVHTTRYAVPLGRATAHRRTSDHRLIEVQMGRLTPRLTQDSEPVTHIERQLIESAYS